MIHQQLETQRPGIVSERAVSRRSRISLDWLLTVPAILIVCAHVTVTYVYSYSVNVELDAPYYFYASIVLMGCGLIFAAYSVTARTLSLNPALSCYLLWLLWCYLEICMHPTHWGTWLAYESILKAAATAFSYYFVVRSRRQFSLLLWGYVIAIFAFTFYNWDNLQYTLSFYNSYDRFAGSAENPNLLAIMALISFSASVMLFIFSKRLWPRVLTLAAAGTSYMLIMYSGSRKGMMGLPLFLFFIYIFVLRKLPKSKLHKFFLRGTILAVLVLCLVGLARSYYGERLTNVMDIGSEVSLSQRYDFLIAGFQMLFEHPIMGVGFDKFRILAANYGAPPNKYSHSTVVEIAACTGIVGFLLYFGSFFLICKQVWQNRRYALLARDTPAIVLWGGAISILLLVLFLSIFSVAYDSKVMIPLSLSIASIAKRFALRKDFQRRVAQEFPRS